MIDGNGERMCVCVCVCVCIQEGLIQKDNQISLEREQAKLCKSHKGTSTFKARLIYIKIFNNI